MPIERRTSERFALWERLALIVVGAFMSVAIRGVYEEISDLGEKLQDVGTSQAVTTVQLIDLRDRMGGFYSVRAADAEHARIWKTDNHQYKRLNDHEKRLRDLEARLHGR